MPIDNYRLSFPLADFTELTGPLDIAQLTTALLALRLESPVLDVRELTIGGASIEWQSLVSEADRNAVTRLVAEYTQPGTTRVPHLTRLEGGVQNSSSLPERALELVTTPLIAGRYRVEWLCGVRLSALASGTRAKAIFACAQFQQAHHETDVFVSAFNGSVTVEVREGETITAALHVAKIGAGAVAAELRDATLIVTPA